MLLVTAPTVRGGLLSWQAWQVLGGAARVLAPSAGHPLLPALDEAGIAWEVLAGSAGAAPPELARLLTGAVAGTEGPVPDGTVVWLSPPDPPGRPAGEPPGALALAGALGGREGPRDTAVEVLYGSSPLPGGELLTLVSVMDTLRRNCPWDARQTHESLAPYLLEESYEALDALESGDRAALREELGDVLLQVMFHARVAAERTDGTGFTVDDVADGIVTKLVRRHPHVFGDVTVSGADDVTRNWDAIKAAERAERAAGDRPASALDGVPPGQPALALAAQLQGRAERAGLPRIWPSPGARTRAAAWGRSCSRWWPRPAGRASTPSLSCAPPPGATLTRCAAGKRTSAVTRRIRTETSRSAWPVPTPAVTPLGSITDKSHRASGVVVASIEAVHARQILDSRGNPTLEVEVALDDGSLGRAAAPSGALTGAFEAVELRDGGDEYGGKSVTKAVQAVIDEIQPELLGYDADDQRLIDQAMIDLDRTPDKSRVGANAITGTSMAVAKAAAQSARLPLFRYLGGPNAHLLPVPMMNILNGGAHADNSVDIQEFMIAPIGAATFTEAVQWGAETYQALKSVLKQHGLATGVGDEGGFAPDLDNNRAALDLIVEAIGKAGFSPGLDVALAIDAAATEFYSDGAYQFEGSAQDAAGMTRIYTEWLGAYPIVSLEDPLSEEDWDGWTTLTGAVGDRVQIVGDDLFVTNPERLRRGIAERAANSLLVKVNQIGSITETLDAVAMAQRSGFSCMISHRSGETDDTTIADLAVAVNAGQIKAGAPARGERVAKYNQLMRIEELLDDAASYAGAAAFPRWTAAE